MVNKAKAQGTAWETAVKKRLISAHFMDPRRLAEGGSQDEGDVHFRDWDRERWVVECKARANLNVTQTLAKAKKKAGPGNRVIVAWKKLTRSEGNERRTADGEPDVVIMDWGTYMYLMRAGS